MKRAATTKKAAKPRQKKSLPKFCEGAAVASSEGSSSIRWHMPGAIPRGCLVILDGRKGVGKSTMLGAFAAAVSGGPSPPHWSPAPPRGVLWLTSEEDYRSMIWPRLKGCGADMARCFRPDLKAEDGSSRPLRIPSGIDDLEALVIGLDVGLIVLDPISCVIDNGLTLRDETEARAYLEPLVALASKRDLLILAARHLRKANQGDIRDHGLGSVGVGNVARSVLRLDEHPYDPTKYTFSIVATNIGKPLPTQLYQLIAGSPDLARIAWLGQSPLTADEIAEGRGTAAEADARHDAEKLLASVIGNTWVSASLIRAEADRAGVSDATLRRAKSALRVPSRRVQQGKKGEWQWGKPKNGWPSGLQKS